MRNFQHVFKNKIKCKLFFFVDLAIQLEYYNHIQHVLIFWWMKVEELHSMSYDMMKLTGLSGMERYPYHKWYGEVSIIELWKRLVIHKVARQSSKHLLIFTQCGPLRRGYVQSFLHTYPSIWHGLKPS